MEVTAVSANSKRTWTPEQHEAITLRNQEILVSAGAGSGKTSVLVERLIRRIFDPADPLDVDQILVVTFTEAAAAEMRERIRTALSEAAQGGDRRARGQLALLGKAAISTLHGFCLQMLRRHFYVLGLDPRFRVMGEDEARLLKVATLNDVFEAVHKQVEAGEGDPWAALIHDYAGARDDQVLKDMVWQLHEYVQSLPEGEAWLDEAGVVAYRLNGSGGAEALDGPEASPKFIEQWKRVLFESAARAVDDALAHLDAALELASLGAGPHTYIPSMVSAKQSLEAVQDALAGDDWQQAMRAFAAVDWPRLKAPKDADQALQAEARALWDGAKKLVRKWSDGAFSRTWHDYLEDLPRLAPVVDALCQLVRRYGDLYRQRKNRLGQVDFSDLERFALDILKAEDGAYAREYQDRFAEVMVDEYQDINPVQDELLRRLSRAEIGVGNRFMVGDVKQSIYRFRLADPTIFQEKYDSFRRPETKGATRIDLRENFRSRPYLLDSVNYLFRQLMHPGTGGIHYDEDAYLRPGRTDQSSDADENERIHLHLIERLDEEGHIASLTPIEQEAFIVADIIGELRSTYRYRDIAVLMRSPKGRAGAFVERLEQMGIPAYTQAGTGFFRAVEVDVVMSLLRLLDNVRQDIPLAAVLRSPIVGLASEDLAQIRIAARDGDFYDAVVAAAQKQDRLGNRLRTFLQALERWRTKARRSLVSRLIRLIYDETGYVDFVAGLPRGAQREANLWGLYHRARQFDHFRTEGLDRFLRFVDDLDDAGEELAPPPTLGEGEDVVQVMSVHQSKGLEFPVVIVVDLDRGFNLTDTHRSLIFHRSLGIGAAVIDRSRHMRYPSLAHRAVAEALNHESVEEEMRLLYVATTRAKEKMFWVASVSDVDRRCSQWAQSTRVTGWPLPAGHVLDAGSWLDWIGRCLIRHRDGRMLRAWGAGDLGEAYYEPADSEVANATGRFAVTLWSAQEVAALAQKSAATPQSDDEELPIAAMAAKQPLDETIPDEVAQEVHRRYAWIYPSDAVNLPAKVSVTEFARLHALLDEQFEDDPLATSDVPLDIDVEAVGDEASKGGGGAPLMELRPMPSFAQPTRAKLSPAARGAAVHRFLALAHIGPDVSEKAVAGEVRRLVEAELLTDVEAKAIDVAAICRFFLSPLGERVIRGMAGEHRMWREKAFIMLKEASALAEMEGYSPRWGDGAIVVQGSIDCLVQEGDGFLLIDYKTDRVAPVEEDRLLDRYRPQLRLYADFVRLAAPDAPIEAYLVFLATGRALRLDV